MKNTIEELVNSTVSNFFSIAISSVEEQKTLSDIVSGLRNGLNDLGIKLIELVCEAVENAFDANRNKHKIVVRNKNKYRNILTEFGTVRMRHTLYYDKEVDRYFFASDELLKIEKYSRIENSLQAKLVRDATLTSYGKASELSDKVVSRQTVFNLVKKLKTIEAPAPETTWDTDNIYIEADEDHIHLNNGKPTEMKLVYVHEGRELARGRISLKNPHYFVSADTDASTLWDDVADYVMSNYQSYKANIHLSGDGASWIKSGISILPNVQYHLDKFHLQKAIQSVVGVSRSDRFGLQEAIRLKNLQAVRAITKNVYGSDRKRNREIRWASLYIQNNLDYIDNAVSCCAEGHVSHILSARLSSRPMAWSRDGAERIARLRAFLFNGGNFNQLITEGKTQKENISNLPYKTKNFCASSKGMQSKGVNIAYSIPGLSNIGNEFVKNLKNILKY